jgi:hypothetical protein
LERKSTECWFTECPPSLSIGIFIPVNKEGS